MRWAFKIVSIGLFVVASISCVKGVNIDVMDRCSSQIEILTGIYQEKDYRTVLTRAELLEGPCNKSHRMNIQDLKARSLFWQAQSLFLSSSDSGGYIMLNESAEIVRWIVRNDTSYNTLLEGMYGDFVSFVVSNPKVGFGDS